MFLKRSQTRIHVPPPNTSRTTRNCFKHSFEKSL